MVRRSSVGKLAGALNEYIRDSLMRPKIADSGSSRKIVNSKPKALSDSDFWAAGLGVDRQLLARLRELDMQEKKKAGKTCNDP